jgi:hypothetical protein
MRLNKRGFSAVELLICFVLVGAIGATGWSLYSRQKADKKNENASISSFEECKAAGNPIMESYPEQCSANGQTFTNNAQNAFNGEGWEDVVSSKGRFTVSIPNGWEIQSATEYDGFLIRGEKQPTMDTSKKLKVTKIDSFCCHGPDVFSMKVDEKQQTPRGEVTDFTVNNGDKTNMLTGKKYVYEYDQDLKGDYVTRVKGDRDYVYTFDVGGGKELVINYSVYASDPKNQISTIDKLVQSLRLQK